MSAKGRDNCVEGWKDPVRRIKQRQVWLDNMSSLGKRRVHKADHMISTSFIDPDFDEYGT